MTHLAIVKPYNALAFALQIPVELLWDLTILFGVISGVYLLLIFYFRHRLLQRDDQLHEKKRELGPMISQFLFYPREPISAGQESHLNQMQEFRAFVATPDGREAFAQVLMELVRDVSGEARRRLLSLYQELGLQEAAYRKLQSRKWEVVSGGILELSEMQVTQACQAIRPFVHHKNSILRKQAQLAVISLEDEGIGYFLDTAHQPISQWQQIQIMESLRRKEDFNPPEFANWLTCDKEEVICFALRLLKAYDQVTAADAVIPLISHPVKAIRVAALECIRKFEYAPARDALLEAYALMQSDNRILILDTLQRIADVRDISWLELQASEDSDFLVKSKAKSVLAAVRAAEKELPAGNQLDLFEERPVQTPAEAVGAVEASNPKGGIPQETERGIRTRLKPDFGTEQEATEAGSPSHISSEVSDTLLESTVHFPREYWSQEQEYVFDECLIEALIEVVYGISMPAGHTDHLPVFLPYVTQPTQKPTDMDPYKNIPEWLWRLEVQAEIIFSDSGHARMLRAILLEGLEETGNVLDTEFVPWDTTGQNRDGADTEAVEELENTPQISPEFDVLSEEILHTPPGIVDVPATDPAHTGDAEGDSELSYFSIFQEFFLSYDTESKLILMDEIPEIGGIKELEFLSGLFQDPDKRIRQKARITYEILESRLKGEDDSMDTLEDRPLWLPHVTPSVKEVSDTTPDDTGSAAENEELTGELNFTPEFESKTPGEPQRSAAGHPESQDGYLNLLRHMNRTQEKDNAH